MAEVLRKGAIIEFDFAAMDGAGILHAVTTDLLKSISIPFNDVVEAKHFAGSNYQGALAEYFAMIKTKRTAAKAAKDLAEAFKARLNVEVPKAITPGFRNFVKTLTERGVQVVISTRADLAAVSEAFAPLLGDQVALHAETSMTYGSVKWDAWRRACAEYKLRNFATIAVTGSGYGVKSALIAGMGSVAVINDRVAYQDFGGADEIVKELNGTTAKRVLEILRV